MKGDDKAEVFYHVRVKAGEVGRYCLLPGDPGRVELLSAFLDDTNFVSRNREFTVMEGHLEGQKVTICSTGIGAPSAAIAMEELSRAGCHTFLRVGTCGPIQREVKMGDLVIAMASVKMEGTSSQYIMEGFPANASPILVLALARACTDLNLRHHLGVVASTDSFYVGQARPGGNTYLPSKSRELLKDLKRAGVLCFEMETSVLFTLANIYGLRAGAILVAIPAIVNDPKRREREELACKAAIEGLRLLIKWDSEGEGAFTRLPPSVVGRRGG